jgi:hypothetical protein
MKNVKVFTLLLAVCLSLSLLFAAAAAAGEVQTLGLVNHIDSSWNSRTVLASPKSDMLLIQESFTWNIYLYNMNSGIKKELVNTLSYGLGSLGCMCFSLDGSMCAVVEKQANSDYENVMIFDTKSGEIINEI